MKNLLLKGWNALWAFFKKYPELLTIPSGFVVWILSVWVLRWIDPTAGIFDAGVFQIPIFSVIQFLIYTAIAWMILRILYGTVSKYLRTGFKNDFKTLTPWQKIKLSYSVFFFLVAVLAYLARTLVTA